MTVDASTLNSSTNEELLAQIDAIQHELNRRGAPVAGLEASGCSLPRLALRESDPTLHMLITASPLPIVSVDAEARVTGWNPAATALFGWTAEEVLGRELPYVPAGQEAEADALFQQGLAGSIAGPIQIQRCRKDGQLLHLRLWPSFIRDGQGRFLVAFGLYEDVTEHIQADAALRESEQRYQSLYENNPSMYFTLSPEGRVLSVNRFGAEQLGYVQNELLGMSVLQVFDPTDHATVLAQLRTCVQNPFESFSWEIGKVRKDGSRLWVKERARCIVDHRGQTTVLIVCEDITERKQAEAVLQDSERRLRLIVDNEPECVKIVTPDGIVQTMNPAGVFMVEAASEAEVCGQSVFSLIHPDDCAAYTRFHEAVCAGQSGSLSFRIKGLRGTERVVESHAVPLRDQSGGVTSVLSVTRDITEQCHTEQALQESEARFRQIAETIEEVVWSADPAIGRMLYISPAYERVWGRSCASLYEQPKSFLEAIHPEDRPAVLATLTVQQDGLPFTHEYRVVRPDGSVRWVWDRGFPVIDPATKHPTHYVGVALDITERKLAEEALRASELRLQRFVAEAPIGLVILDSQRRVLTANKAFCELTGYAEQDLIGHTDDLYTHPDDLTRTQSLTDEFQRSVHPIYGLEKRYVRKGGETIWVSVKGTGIELPNHTGPLLLAAVQDITERRRAAEERERFSQDLHDNILQSLYAVGLQLEASKLSFGKAPRKSKAYTTHAIEHLNRLVGDVRQFIALLRQETSSTFDFGQALRHLADSFSPAGETATELDIKDSALSMISSEQGEQLLNIAREALSNSLRHAQAAHRWVRLSQVPGAIRMQICDDGIGFNPTRKCKLGQGLANMKARAARIRARFSLDTSPRHGTAITIDLPMEDSHEDP